MIRIVYCCLALAWMSCVGIALADPLVEFGPSQRIGNSGSSSYLEPVLAELPDGSVGVAWLEEIDRIYFQSTADGGATWSAASQINNTNAGDRYHPRLWVDPRGSVYAAWQDYRRTGRSDNEIYFSSSVDNGATWSANVPVYAELRGDQLIGWGSGVAPDGTVYVFYGQDRGSRYDSTSVHMKSSTDGGVTWGPEYKASPDGLTRATYQALDIAPDGTLNLLYSGSDIESRYHIDPRTYFVRSSDGGQTWSTPVLVDSYAGDTGRGGVKTQLGRGPDGSLYALWTDGRNGDNDVYFAKSVDGGASWSPVRRLNDISAGDQMKPSIQVVGDDLYVLWADRAAQQIRMSVSRDGGGSWFDSFRVDDGLAGNKYVPSLLATDGALYAAWTQQNGDLWEARFARADLVAPVPEPTSATLILGGLAGLLWYRRRRRVAQSNPS